MNLSFLKIRTKLKPIDSPYILYMHKKTRHKAAENYLE